MKFDSEYFIPGEAYPQFMYKISATLPKGHHVKHDSIDLTNWENNGTEEIV